MGARQCEGIEIALTFSLILPKIQRLQISYTAHSVNRVISLNQQRKHSLVLKSAKKRSIERYITRSDIRINGKDINTDV